MKGADMLLKKQALISFCSLVHSPQMVSQGIQCGVISILKTFLSDEDLQSMKMSSEILFVISNHATGRLEIIAHNCLTDILTTVKMYII